MEKIQVLTREEEIISQYRKYGAKIPSNFVAFYHGGIDAIILERSLMLIHYFDRQVHRGYAVFDTCNMFNRKFYLFDQHMSRFNESMKLANLKPSKTPEQIHAIMSRIASLVGQRNLTFRYWCSRGAHNLDIVTSDEEPTVFYLIAMKGRPVTTEKGLLKAYTVDTEIKSPILAEMKTTNYLLNCLAADKAALKGGLGIMVTEDGYVTEGSVQAVGFVLRDGTYYAPPYYRALRSVTQDRVLELVAARLVKAGLVTRISRVKKTAKELKKEAVEMMLLGGEKVFPVGSWDGVVISDTVGPVTQAITKLLEEDYSNPDMTYEATITKL
eukprot:TRINITY_DN10838_c0_g4_i1.p1 TRINITY_DN10838_c0_g4~~TRINITY_DN10838_c0_g4_i1.p1  ORF type:complete len:327 (+),score=74.08 TRINITY_DN10838_c0_g4_i1:124-1104(+)